MALEKKYDIVAVLLFIAGALLFVFGIKALFSAVKSTEKEKDSCIGSLGSSPIGKCAYAVYDPTKVFNLDITKNKEVAPDTLIGKVTHDGTYSGSMYYWTVDTDNNEKYVLKNSVELK